MPKNNVKITHDCYKNYVDEHRYVVVFQEGEKDFLKVLEHSASLKMGKVCKLSLRYCGHFIILKRRGDMLTS